MFELNLIKDKAKARQRRRIIFLSIVGILFLSGLLSIFVFFALFWQETIKLENAEAEVARVDKSLKELKGQLDKRQPAARKRRNALIEAYQEDVLVRKDHPTFNPILEDLAKHHPSTAEFWYNSVLVTPDTEGTGPQAASGDEYAEAKELMGTRGLVASGYVEIVASDVLTQSDLAQMAQQMKGMVKLVGEPSFTILLESEIRPSGSEDTPYVPFTMRAAQQMFRSEAP
jgi:hypothetical protein